MAWTSPMTAVANAVLTAAQWNAHVRDNLNETAPAKATRNGQLFVSTGANAIAARFPDSQILTTSQTSSSTSYTDLSTVGPSVTVTTGSRAMVVVAADLGNNTLGQNAYMSYAVTGASSFAAADENALRYQAWGANARHGGDRMTFIGNLTPGNNTFTAKYRVDGGTGTWDNRRIVVIPF